MKMKAFGGLGNPCGGFNFLQFLILHFFASQSLKSMSVELNIYHKHVTVTIPAGSQHQSILIYYSTLPAIHLTCPGTMGNRAHQIGSNYWTSDLAGSIADGLMQLFAMLWPLLLFRSPTIGYKYQVRMLSAYRN